MKQVIEINNKFQVKLPPKVIKAGDKYIETIKPFLDELSYYEMKYVIDVLTNSLFFSYEAQRHLDILRQHKEVK